MVQLIVGNKGKGKTKQLLDKVNNEIEMTKGNIVYLDKSTKHMFELNNRIRLIDVSDYLVTNADEFLGFICGIISQDHDVEKIYIDSLLILANLEGTDVTPTIEKLEEIGAKFNVDFVVCMSLDENTVPESLKSKIIISL
ncbi:MAG: twitching motility protein PilT [Lachnospiraceae bacterium]|jgi:hypothetical protein|nr:twitching motility protein PilT [Lachnospiraceae bacterium]